MTKTILTAGAAVLALSAAMTSAASAATHQLVEPLISTGPFETDVAGPLINLPLFDSNLGILTGVSVQLDGTVTGGALLENISPQEEIFNFNISGSGGVDVISTANNAVAQDLAAQGQFSYALPTRHYDLKPVGHDNANGNYGPFSLSWADATITGLPVGDFEKAGGGTDPINIDVSSFPNADTNAINFSSVFYDSDNPMGAASIQVTYTWIDVPPVAEVPEPATWAMLLMGVGMAGGAMRSARRRGVVAG
jgi:hypothetical protein